jgi:hypothetical protein
MDTELSHHGADAHSEYRDHSRAILLPMKNVCGSKLARGICQRAAGWGTDHRGVGRCRKHDIIPSSVHTSLPEPEPSLKKLAELFQKDKEPFELREEIAICRAMIAKLLDEADGATDLARVSPAMNQLLNTTGKLVQRLHEIEVGRQYVVRVDQVQQSLQAVLAIVIEHVPDPTARAEIADRISSISVLGSAPVAPKTELNPTQKELVLLAAATKEAPDRLAEGTNLVGE